MDALRRERARTEIGESGRAELVTVAPARSSGWSTRVIAVTRSSGRRPIRERVLLVLPVGPLAAARSDPGGVGPHRRAAPGARRLRRASVARAPGHPRRPRRVELAAGRTTRWSRRSRRPASRPRSRRRRARHDGVRRAIVLGVVLGEDEGLPEPCRTTSAPPASTTSWPSRDRTSPSSPAGSTGSAGCCGSEVVRELATSASIAAYVLAVGWQPSVVRAGVAGGLASLAWLAARPSDRWHFLALGALVLMAWMPTSLLEPGFQLSFAAVAAIFVAVPRVRRRLDGLSASRRGCRRPRRRGRLRARHGADRPRPLRRGAGLHGARERRRLRRGAAGARPRACSPRSSIPSRRRRRGSRVARGLGCRLARARRTRRRGPAERAGRRAADWLALALGSRPGWHSARCADRHLRAHRVAVAVVSSARLLLSPSRRLGRTRPDRRGIHRPASV